MYIYTILMVDGSKPWFIIVSRGVFNMHAHTDGYILILVQNRSSQSAINHFINPQCCLLLEYRVMALEMS